MTGTYINQPENYAHEETISISKQWAMLKKNVKLDRTIEEDKGRDINNTQFIIRIKKLCS